MTYDYDADATFVERHLTTLFVVAVTLLAIGGTALASGRLLAPVVAVLDTLAR